jgi:UDP-glucose 4-epimerase
MTKKRILVTGGTGFIGSHLVKALVAAGYSVMVVDDLSVANRSRLPSSVRFYQAAVQDPGLESLFLRLRPQIVFHLAADNRVTSSPAATLKSNVIGTFNILNLSKRVKVQQFVFTSSAAVYGQAVKLPIRESSPTRPISAYGLSKLTGELYCQLFQPSFVTNIFRLANIYGPGQNSSSEGGVVAIFIRQLLEGKTPVIFGDGNQLRDFVYVGDVVSALVSVLSKPQSTLLNLGSGKPISIKQLLNLIARLLDKPVLFKTKPRREGEITKSQFSHSLATKTLSWEPSTSLELGLKQTIKDFTRP